MFKHTAGYFVLGLGLVAVRLSESDESVVRVDVYGQAEEKEANAEPEAPLAPLALGILGMKVADLHAVDHAEHKRQTVLEEVDALGAAYAQCVDERAVKVVQHEAEEQYEVRVTQVDVSVSAVEDENGERHVERRRLLQEPGGSSAQAEVTFVVAAIGGPQAAESLEHEHNHACPNHDPRRPHLQELLAMLLDQFARKLDPLLHPDCQQIGKIFCNNIFVVVAVVLTKDDEVEKR